MPGARAGGNAFAPELEAPADASPMEKLVAYTGRRPLLTA